MLSPALYHAHHRNYTEDLPFWHALAQEAGGPILELGCGTGRVLLPLLRQGLPLYGLDNDLAMLAYLRRHAPAALRPRLRLVQADLSAPPFAPASFALILLPCNTFTLLDAATRQRTLEAVARCLRPGGRFACSQPNPHLLRKLPAEGESEVEDWFPHPDTGHPVQVSSAWEMQPERFVLTWHYDHLWPDGVVERITVRQEHALLTVDDLRAACQATGLRLLACYGDFTRAPYTPEAPYLIWIAERPF